MTLATDVHAAPLSDAQRRAVFEEATAAYERGVALRVEDEAAADAAFRDAAERFTLLINDGVTNGRLHYNLGNAYLQLDDLGRAILHYRLAQRFMPGDDRLAANLVWAQSQVELQLEPPRHRAVIDALLWPHRRISPTARLAAFTVAWILCWCLIGARTLGRGGSAVTTLAAVLGVIALALGASVWASTAGAGETMRGVILHDSVTVRQGSGDGYPSQFDQPLTPGVEFAIRDRRGEWLLIELVNGRTGWIPRSTAGLY